MPLPAFLRPKHTRELDALIAELKTNLANNYKSAAHDALDRLGRRVAELQGEGALTNAEYAKYSGICERYVRELRDYHH